jgi:hypothetical protein
MFFNRFADVSIRKGWTDDCLLEIPCIQGIDPFSERPMKKIAHFCGGVENLLEDPATKNYHRYALGGGLASTRHQIWGSVSPEVTAFYGQNHGVAHPDPCCSKALAAVAFLAA